MDNNEIIKVEATRLLDNENSGHNMDHIIRVENLAIKIALKENANVEIARSIALLHDVDDYKLFGDESAKNLTNTNYILGLTTYNDDEKELIKAAVNSIGYSKRLAGITPESLEAKIVSDADMLDAIGANGLLRSYQYNIAHNNPIFDRNEFPTLDMDAETYKARNTGTVINHIFEKMLKLKDLMLTKTGYKEALVRHNFLIEFLRQFFYEEDAPEWTEYLDNYVRELKM